MNYEKMWSELKSMISDLKEGAQENYQKNLCYFIECFMYVLEKNERNKEDDCK